MSGVGGSSLQPGQASCLYVGSVTHRRHAPRVHALRYRIFSLFIDLDQIDRTKYAENTERAARDDGRCAPSSTRLFTRWFSHNRFNLYSFHDADHGDGSATPLRVQVERLLAYADVDLQGGAIRLLCMPRVLGYVFNPLSVYYCHDNAGRLAAVVYEVNNTFGQRHTYVFPVSPVSETRSHAGVIEQQCQKRFHVSPFLDMDMRYRFRLIPPAETLSLSIRTSSPSQPMLDAAYHAKRTPLGDATWLRLFVTHPLLTLKVIVGIHWEALQVWRKGAGYRRCPAPGPTLSVMDAAGNLLDISSKQVS